MMDEVLSWVMRGAAVVLGGGAACLAAWFAIVVMALTLAKLRRASMTPVERLIDDMQQSERIRKRASR
jgi:hypothetical protein